MKHNNSIYHKIKNLQELLPVIEFWKKEGETIVFTNGCFDILHLGHVDYLSKAADKGTKFIVGINSDSSIKLLQKGASRPLQDEKSRATVISSLGFVDNVIVFDEETPLHLISSILPDILIKGGDYKIEEIVGYKEVINNGGKVELIDFVPGYSTTAIENKILNK